MQLESNEQPSCLTFKLCLYKGNRQIPLAIYTPAGGMKENLIPVLFSPGYDKRPEENAHAYLDYGYIGEALSNKGCVMISVQCHIDSDPPLSMTHPYIQTRMQDWLSGSETMLYVATTLKLTIPQLDWNKSIIMGHSNGGDIASLAFKQGSYFSSLITIDNRRYPVPDLPNVATIRCCDYPADPEVLPENPLYTRIFQLENVGHSDVGLPGDVEQHSQITDILSTLI